MSDFIWPLVSDVVGRIRSAVIQRIGSIWGVGDDLLALENTYKHIQGVLHDAEKKKTTEQIVEVWLGRLKSASLEVENVLDEAKTEEMIQTNLQSVIPVFPSHHIPLLVKNRIVQKVKNIREKLKDIDTDISRFRLTHSEVTAGIVGEISNRETSSLVNLSKIYGRAEEKKMIVDKIRNQGLGRRRRRDEDDVDEVRVYAIWGMGGIGKTTMAQYVYNDKMVKRHFDLTFWVYVSDAFDVKRIITSICGSEDAQLDAMQLCLQNTLRGKRFLIVMDDVWIGINEMEKWEELCKAFSYGAKGSTVMVTTRSEDTAKLMATKPNMRHNLGFLSDEESWWLFKMLAFPGGVEKENQKDLELVGREIVEKCKRLPLAVKTLGSLMSTKESVSEWQLVNDKFISEMQDNGILPALRLSYDDLVPHLKRCFAYCCLFRKGEEMSKDLLVELWMANGFIPSHENVSLYVLGEEIFTCLVRRSFFQDVVEKDRDTGCKMHDLMHDLAKSAMGDDCAVIAPGMGLMTSNEVLHLSLSWKRCFKFSEEYLGKMRSVRSMLLFDKDNESSIEQISNHVYLRVLYLNKVESVPESICRLMHLRYLKISYSKTKVLPESIIYLQNLQVLILECCFHLCELPKGLRYMRNLQHLDVGDSLRHMPVGIKELTNLRRLSQFVVGKDNGFRIGELGNLNLGWKLRLKELENVGGLRDAKRANLKDKTNLKCLALHWSLNLRSDNTCIDSEEVVEGLEPNSGLQELIIEHYMGRVLSPSWMVKLLNLTNIEFYWVNKCEELPPLGKLPGLKIIKLDVMPSLKCFHGNDNATSTDEILFPNLQELHIFSSSSLVTLPSNFPKLRLLEIESCNKLRSIPDEIQSFKDLNQIIIEDCEILSRRCEKRIGEDWPKISHIPHLDIQLPRSTDEDEDNSDDSVNYRDED